MIVMEERKNGKRKLFSEYSRWIFRAIHKLKGKSHFKFIKIVDIIAYDSISIVFLNASRKSCVPEHSFAALHISTQLQKTCEIVHQWNKSIKTEVSVYKTETLQTSSTLDFCCFIILWFFWKFHIKWKYTPNQFTLYQNMRIHYMLHRNVQGQRETLN